MSAAGFAAEKAAEAKLNLTGQMRNRAMCTLASSAVSCAACAASSSVSIADACALRLRRGIRPTVLSVAEVCRAGSSGPGPRRS